MNLYQIAHRTYDFTSKGHSIVVQHISQSAENERDQRDELDRVIRLQLGQQRTHCSTGLHLDERMIVLLQRLVEDSDETRDVIAIDRSEVGDQIVENRQTA